MITKLAQFVLIMAYTMCAFCLQQNDAFGKEDEEKKVVDLSFGYSAKDWKLISRLNETAYYQDQPIQLEVTLLNISSGKRLLGEHWGFIDYTIQIVDSSAKEVPLTDEGKKARDYARITKILHRSVPMGMAFKEVFDLRKFFILKHAGKYRIVVRRGLSDIVPPSGGEIPKGEARYEYTESDPIEFEISSPANAK